MRHLTVAQCTAALLRARETGGELTPALLAEIEATVERGSHQGTYKQELLTLIDLLEAREVAP